MLRRHPQNLINPAHRQYPHSHQSSNAHVYFSVLEKPRIFQRNDVRQEFLLKDVTRLGALVRHISLINHLPNWAIPRFAAFLHHSSFSTQGQIRWCHRFILDRKRVIWREIDNAVDQLMDALSEGKQIIRQIDQILHQHKAPVEKGTDENQRINGTIEKILCKIRQTRRCDNQQSKWVRTVLTTFTGDVKFKLAEEKITRSIASSLDQTISKLHPAGKLLVHEFLSMQANVQRCEHLNTTPMERLLCRGLGFVPRPKTLTVVSNIIAHATRNTHLLQHIRGHPGAESPAALLYHEKLKDLCHNIVIPDNLPADERKALTDATKNTTYVFVPTDKTNKVLLVTRNLIGTAIEKFLEKGRGKTFDLFDDPVTFGAILMECKQNTRKALEIFLTEIKHIPLANNYKGTPDLVHGVRFPKGTPALEKIIKVLANEFDYAPSFGPLKPHIKDHKMKGDVIHTIAKLEAELEQGSTDFDPGTIPLRLTHKATCGPTSAVAEIIAPILEKLASLCKLSLTQASADVAEFLFRHSFTSKPAFAALDVVDAFWQMNKETCLKRVRMLVRRYPQVLASFGITENALIEAIDLVWNDNLFAAMGPDNKTLYGKILGCTMGSMISMALCRIYYFTSLIEAIDTIGANELVWLKSGGDDALVIAWKDNTIDLLLDTLNNLDDNWRYELRKPDPNGTLSFFDLDLKLHQQPDETLWTFQTGVFFKPTDSLSRTCASSFWSWDHAEALLRTHLHRTAILCSSINEAALGILKLGTILARRHHPLDQILTALERLNPVFRAEHPVPRRALNVTNHTFQSPFGEWSPDTDPSGLRLPGTIPFLGSTHNDAAKRITGEFLNKVAVSLKLDMEVVVSVNNVPFKTLGRLLPLAKPKIPCLLDANVVYKISNEDSDRCGVGQVGWRPLKHRINEHTWAAPSRNPYAQTDLVPFRDATVVAKENNPHLRLAFEAIHIYLNPNCITAPSVDITVWHNTLDKLSPKGRFPAGGGDPPPVKTAYRQTTHRTQQTPPKAGGQGNSRRAAQRMVAHMR